MTRLAVTGMRGILLAMLGGTAACAAGSAAGDPMTGEAASAVTSAGGLEILDETTPGGAGKPIFDSPDVFRKAFEAEWTESRAHLCEALRVELSRDGAVAKDLQMSDIRCETPGDGTLQMDQRGKGMALAYQLAGSSLEMTATLPKEHGASAVQRFTVSYDISLTTTLSLPSRRGKAIGVSLIDVGITRVKVMPVGAEDAPVFEQVQTFFTAPTFGDLVQKEAQEHGRELRAAIESELQPAEEALENVKKHHRHVRMSFDAPDAKGLVIKISDGEEEPNHPTPVPRHPLRER